MTNMSSIGKFTDTIFDVKHHTYYVETLEDGTVIMDESRELPTLDFVLTTKLHGTFAGIKLVNNQELIAMSKGDEISVGHDNAGFASFVDKNKDYFTEMLQALSEHNPNIEEMSIMGEWAGPSIQKGCGINLIPEKTFFMFGLKYKLKNEEKRTWARGPATTLEVIANHAVKEGIDNLYSIFKFPTWELRIDFNNPEKALMELDGLRDSIDKECPVAKALGFEGFGEGVVATAFHNDNHYVFKHKGESHSKVAKIKQPKEKDPLEQEKLDVAQKVTTKRLKQAVQEVCDTNNGGTLSMKNMGDVIHWVQKDIIKEDMDILHEAGFEITDINKFVSSIVVSYVKSEIEREALK